MRKRIAILCFFIAALCMCAMPAPAFADGTVADDDTTWDGGTWSVVSDVTLSNRVKVQGTVELVLGAGTTLTAPQGITVDAPNNKLIITGEGALVAGTADHSGTNGQAGIGASAGAAAGTIVIEDGTVTAYGGQGSEDKQGAAGIGGSPGTGAPSSGTIRIDGGTVKAYGGGELGGAGIGGQNGCGADVTITDGDVYAEGGSAAAAIGAGNDAGNNVNRDVNITISGGTVNVGAGVIGGAWHPGEVTVTITGGQVTGIIGTNNLMSGSSNATVALGWSDVEDFVDAR